MIVMNYDAQPHHYAYIDESGDHNLDLSKQGTTKFYVVTAVLVDEQCKDNLIRQVDGIRSRFFGKGEMKSSSLGSDIKRRSEILAELVNTGIKFYSLVVDKGQIISSSGLQYKKTFIKYIQGRLYKRLYHSFISLTIFADEHGRSEFMESFEKYMKTHYQKNLWDQEDFKFVPSCDYPLIQASDMLGGSLRRIYSSEDPREILDVLKPAKVFVQRWPPNREYADIISGLDDQERFDYLVESQGLALVYDFINENEGSNDPDIESQVETLHYLLSQYEIDPTCYLTAEPILKHVNFYREEDISIQTFRTNIIAVLRSKGVIIASSNKGYKIPNTAADMDSFVALVNDHTLPYLERLAQAKRQIYSASKGDYDIVEKYPKLSECLKSLERGQYE
jgi:hypothetical protein